MYNKFNLLISFNTIILTLIQDISPKTFIIDSKKKGEYFDSFIKNKLHEKVNSIDNPYTFRCFDDHHPNSNNQKISRKKGLSMYTEFKPKKIRFPSTVSPDGNNIPNRHKYFKSNNSALQNNLENIIFETNLEQTTLTSNYFLLLNLFYLQPNLLIVFMNG